MRVTSWLRWVTRAAGLVFLFALPSMTQNTGSPYTNFEGALTNPIRLSSDGTRLYAVNNPKGTLSVFDVSTNPSSPALLSEIPVGVEPVSVNPRTNDEVWVVNQESNSVSIVSVSQRIVVDTLHCPVEPSDVVFAGQYAFVSEARNNQIAVFDAVTHTVVKQIAVFGGGPRAMTVGPDGSTVYAAFALSGNGTTLVTFNDAPPPPPPTNPALPPAPAQGIIIQWNDPSWAGYVGFTMPDNDVVSINASTLAINGYYSAVGTLNLGLAVQPSTGNLYVTNTDALNLVRFETNLNGHFVNNRVTKITPSGTVTAYDLNPTLDYTNLPDPNSIAIALAQPAGIVFDAAGVNMYVAAFGTDRVAYVDPNRNVLNRIEIDPEATGSTVAPATKRGPRGLAINPAQDVLYVHNRISNTISVINTSSKTVVNEVKTGSTDPTSAAVKAGRGFLYDAKLSGNGSGSCAACHLDGEGDHLSWDLGDPSGSMFAVTLNTGATFEEHPMKGPMNTLTLRGLVNEQPYHWRGDKPEFSDFNVAFQQLMGGTQISSTDMTAFTNFVNTITFLPNPYQNLNRTYPTSLEGGNAQRGESEFITTAVNAQGKTCNTCHSATNFGSDLEIFLLAESVQPMKATLLRATYQKQLFNNTGPTIDGFGILHDGGEENIHSFVGGNLFPNLAGHPITQNDISAFNLSMDTGTAPAVGYGVTLTAADVSSSATTTAWSTLESQAGLQYADLVANGTIHGVVSGLLYMPATKLYQQEPSESTYTHEQVVSLVEAGDTLTIMGVPYGAGSRIAALSARK
jgi:YVTN family beta-propeller protein